MILIFGGTTEGRRAVSVAEAAGKSYYYSTLTSQQEISCGNGIRLCGGMDESSMLRFCTEKGIRLIIDAAHPFATGLHDTVSKVARQLSLNVIRFERQYPERSGEVIWCENYTDAICKMEDAGTKRLLALTGVQTISKLRAFWERHDCHFRILDREDSMQKAAQAGFPNERLVYYEDDNLSELFEQISPDAIITKESGESGFFQQKVETAKAFGIKVFAVMRPPLPSEFITVTGEFGLRREIERLLPDFFPLKSGFTTGSCATAAAKAALLALIEEEYVDYVTFTLPDGEVLSMPVKKVEYYENHAIASVIKDAGDDPDVTDGIEIVADVSLSDSDEIRFFGGEGVGKITLPGFGLEIGEPAINRTPREMMRRELSSIYSGGIDVTISVPKGKEIAKKTFNPRIGIIDGISIIGTTGIVQPFSHDAFIASIRKCLEVAAASGAERVVINSGARSEGYVRRIYQFLPDQAFVHYGNAIGETLKLADSLDISKLTIGMMIGKAVKFAEGAADTHSHTVTMNLDFVVKLARESGCTEKAEATIEGLNLARQLWNELSKEDADRLFNAILQHCIKTARQFYHGSLEILLIRDDGEISYSIEEQSYSRKISGH